MYSKNGNINLKCNELVELINNFKTEEINEYRKILKN